MKASGLMQGRTEELYGQARALFDLRGGSDVDSILMRLDPFSGLPVQIVPAVDEEGNLIGVVSSDCGADSSRSEPPVEPVIAGRVPNSAKVSARAAVDAFFLLPLSTPIVWRQPNPKIRDSAARYAQQSKSKTLGERLLMGRLDDLRWDIARSFVRAELPSIVNSITATSELFVPVPEHPCGSLRNDMPRLNI